MNKLFSLFPSVIKSIFDFPHRLFSFPHKSKTDRRGVIYASQFKRSVSTITDLLFCVLILKVSGYLLSFLVDLQFPVEVLERYRFSLPISQAERALITGFYKSVLVVQVFQLILLAILFVTCWHRFGCTPGKWILRLRLLDDETLEKPSVSACIKRLIMLPLSLLAFFLGILWSIFDKKSRTWHDIFAGTVVVSNSAEIFKKDAFRYATCKGKAGDSTHIPD
ncbi:RDD family protein [Neorickettsia risticii]|uniref:RDD family protein n=1 Tax=Neorickettsia risticii (strain Illinois) TaxID=434131 RepID=C6V533_NEORI|nr:RDD family protein [Neorickettsia risticii]ACT69498.1 RDD family protein [Neorickettsia risticii str. Illinois]